MKFADEPDPLPEVARIERMPLDFQSTTRVPAELLTLVDRRRSHFVFDMTRASLADGLQLWVVQEMGLPPHRLQRLLVRVSRLDGSMARMPTSDELWNVRRIFGTGHDCTEIAHLGPMVTEIEQRAPSSPLACPGTDRATTSISSAERIHP